MYMLIFNKNNGVHHDGRTPLKLKKFFDMSKIKTFNLVLQRNGDKNCHLITYQIVTNFITSLG
jgi:hypothetical protein